MSSAEKTIQLEGTSSREVVALRQKETNLLPSSYSCPHCKCHALYCVRRKWFDLPMTIFELTPIRCWTCSRRSHLRLAKGTEMDQPSGEAAAEVRRPLRSKEAA